MVNGEKHEREKKSQTCQIYSEHPMRNLKFTYAKCIYNRYNLPFWLITRCWWEAAAAVGCFQDKYESLGSRRGSTFWFQRLLLLSPSLVPKATLREQGASSIVILFNYSAQLHALLHVGTWPQSQRRGWPGVVPGSFRAPSLLVWRPHGPERGGLELRALEVWGFSKVMSTDGLPHLGLPTLPPAQAFWAMGFISLERLSWNLARV